MDINPGENLSLALATVPTMLIVFIGILIDNSRLTDLRSHMDSRFDEMRATWNIEADANEVIRRKSLEHQ